MGICLILGLVVLTSSSQASFASSDASKTCLDGNCNRKISLKRQILEEILAEIEQQELALQHRLEQQQTVHLQQQQLHQQEQQIHHHQQQHQQQDQHQAQQKQL